jgi:hypothetical protein
MNHYWRNQMFVTFADAEVVEVIEPAKPRPEIPFEVWATPNPDVDYLAEVRVICGGSRS